MAQSISILKGGEGIGASVQDEVRVPVETFMTIMCLTHAATIRLSIIHEAVIWAWSIHYSLSAYEHEDAYIKNE